HVLCPAGDVSPVGVLHPGKRVEAGGSFADVSDIQVDVVLDPHVVSTYSQQKCEVTIQSIRELEAISRIRHWTLADARRKRRRFVVSPWQLGGSCVVVISDRTTLEVVFCWIISNPSFS